MNDFNVIIENVTKRKRFHFVVRFEIYFRLNVIAIGQRKLFFTAIPILVFNRS